MTDDPSRDRQDHAPVLTIRPAIVERNSRRVADRFDGDLVGVTKGVGGDPRVARAMVDGGATAIADSRLANLRRLGDRVDCDRYLLRPPMRHEIDAVVRNAEVSFQSEPSVLRATAAAASRRGVDHRIVLAVDVGDRREGVLLDDLASTLSIAAGIDGIEVAGVAAHTGSLNGVVPTAESVSRFVNCLERAEESISRQVPICSAGSSNTLGLCFDGDLPERVTQLRIGEAILLGTDPTTGEPLPGFETDAVVLSADVIECKAKPSAPTGPTGRDAFGESPTVEDRGVRDRAIVAMGRVDVPVEGLAPVREGVDVLGASSDHAVLDVTAVRESIRPGDSLTFELDYGALARSAASPYVATAYE
ncbi:alanine racemase [Halosolutus amylolyticus]|uniref:Alanine racemase n=1 Tax=Halosolutus amylolyticus TaxID=2932267 RepID=A0ABD5PRL6_9EURY|nr:alanine racemase [Halosolutus amylolyticus]